MILRSPSAPAAARRRAVSAAVVCAAIFTLAVSLLSRPENRAVTAQALSRPPLFFVANQGQRESDIAFTANGLDVEVAFDGQGVSFTRITPLADDPGLRPSRAATEHDPTLRGLRVDSTTGRPVGNLRFSRSTARLSFLGARSDVRPEGHDPLPTRLHLLRGPRAGWHTDIPTYGRIVYPELWPGIDLEYRGVDNAVKYQFVVQPGADPSAIRLAWHGARDVRLVDDGGLEIVLDHGSLHDSPPVAFQPGAPGTAASPVRAVFDLIPPAGSNPRFKPGSNPDSHAGFGLGFDLGAYDPERTLVIDPAVPIYAGFFGGSAYDRGLGIDVDAAGRAYLCGETSDPASGDTDAFVARVAADGSGYESITIIGGDGYDAAYDVAVDAAGHAYLTGATMSDEASFPVISGPDTSFNGVLDVLVAKVAPDGSDLVYAGYLGGELTDFGEGIRVAADGAVYLHGIALSNEATFPVKVGPDLSFNGETDAFVAKLVPDPSADTVFDNLVYAGYIGGDRSDITAVQDGTYSVLSSGHIAIDAAGALYVSGETTSTEASFPDGDGFGDLPGADRTWAGGWDAYAAKVSPDGSRLEYATYVGGEGEDMGKGMAVDATGRAFLTGYTLSTEATMPVTGGPDLSANGEHDILVAVLSPEGDAFEMLGFLGGDDTDGGEAVALDDQGRAYIVGYTESTADTFPVAGGPDLSHNDEVEGEGDAFVLRLSPDPTAPDIVDNVDFAGYIGGAGYDQAFWLALDGAGGIYVAGDTDSGADTFPHGTGLGDLPGPQREAPGGPSDGFVMKLDADGVAPTPGPRPDPAQAAIYLPLALADEALDGPAARGAVVAANADPSVPRAPAALVLAQDGPVRVPRSYDDFCDFAVGWVWDEDNDVEVHPEIDELAHCTFVMSRLTEGAYGGFSSNVPTPEDFHLEAAVEMQGDNGVSGLIFGASDQLDALYIFALIDPGEYLLAHLGASTTLLDQGTLDFDPMQPITLGVSALGETITLSVNGETISAVENAGPHAGRVGTYVEGVAGSLPFTARYDWIRFDELVAAPSGGGSLDGAVSEPFGAARAVARPAHPVGAKPMVRPDFSTTRLRDLRP